MVPELGIFHDINSSEIVRHDNASTASWEMDMTTAMMNASQNNQTNLPSGVEWSSSLVKASIDIESYIVPVIVIVGLAGNALSFVVFSQKTFIHSVSSMLFRVLAVVDSLSMLTYDVIHIIADRLGSSVVTRSTLTCRMFIFPYFLLRTYSGWIIALVCLERVIGIVSPHRARVLCTHRRFRVFLLVELLILVAAYSPLIASTGYYGIPTDDGETMNYCSIMVTDNAGLIWFASEMFLYMNLVLGSLLPFVLILSLNVTIVVTVLRQTPLSASRSGSNSSFNSMSVMLLLVSGTFLVLSIPYPIYFLLDHYSRIEGIIDVDIEVLILMGTVCNTCDTLNHSVNIFMYCLSGTKFRTAFLGLLTCRQPTDKTKPASQPPTTTVTCDGWALNDTKSPRHQFKLNLTFLVACRPTRALNYTNIPINLFESDWSHQNRMAGLQTAPRHQWSQSYEADLIMANMIEIARSFRHFVA